MKQPTHPANEPSWRPLALSLGLFAIALSILFRLLPPDSRGWWNFTPVGAMCLYAGARMRFWPALVLPMVVLGLTNHYFWLTKAQAFPVVPFLCFVGYILLGRWLLRRTESPVRIGATALLASALFFLVTNFEAWLQQVLPYGYGLDGLLTSYEMALPFYRGTIIGDVAFSAAFFGAHALLARAYFPAERVATTQPERSFT